MTLGKAVESFDLLYPNTFSYEQKVEAVSRLDKRIAEELLSKYENDPAEGFAGYSVGSPRDTRLLVSGSFEGIYVKYLAAFTDFINGDIARYNNSAGTFNAEYDAFCKAYNRSHTWKKSVRMGDCL